MYVYILAWLFSLYIYLKQGVFYNIFFYTYVYVYVYMYMYNLMIFKQKMFT